jgi:hypothetical protein
MMSGTQQQIRTGNGTQRRAPPKKAAAGRRKRRTKAQIAAAKQQIDLGAGTVAQAAATKLPRDPMLTFCEQTRDRLAVLSPAQQIAAKAWMKATYAA